MFGSGGRGEKSKIKMSRLLLMNKWKIYLCKFKIASKDVLLGFFLETEVKICCQVTSRHYFITVGWYLSWVGLWKEKLKSPIVDGI